MDVSVQMLLSACLQYNYLATVTMQSITETNETFATWTATWDCAADKADAVKPNIEGIFKLALGQLQEQIGNVK